MAGTPVPWPYPLQSLPKKEQERLRRDFDAIVSQMTSTKVYDAWIDPSLAADSIATLTFTTPFAAIAYVRDTLGKNVVSLGWRLNAFAGNNTATETGSYAGTGTVFVSITVVGVNNRGNSLTDLTLPTWAWGTANDSAKFITLSLVGIGLTSSLTAGGKILTNAAATMYADGCAFSGAASATAAVAPAMPGGFYRDCVFLDCSMLGPKEYYWLRCAFQSNAFKTITFGVNMYTWDCLFAGVTTFTSAISLNCAVFIAIGSTWTVSSSWVSVSTPTGTSWTLSNSSPPATQRIYIESVGEASATNQGPIVNFTQPVEALWLEGLYKAITVPAPPVVGSTSGSAHHIHAAVETFFDITGPAEIALRTKQGTNVLRGAGIAGHCMVWGDKGGTVALAFVGVTESVVSVSLQAYGTAGTGKGYTVDAASARNIFIIEGDSLFPGGSTNASGTTLVSNHSVVDKISQNLMPGLLGGDASGVFGVSQYPPAAAGGAVGGALTGSLPNPTFAGRNASGDAMDKDMLPGLLLP